MKLGIIGGSGLYQIDGMTEIKTKSIETPFGEPSANFVVGKINNNDIVFLTRHGKGHTILPSEINFRANIYGMKKLGVTHILSVSAVGSLQADISPRDVVVPDQYFDRTKRPATDHTFFGNGIVAHLPFGHPVCPELSKLAADITAEVIAKSDAPDRKVHRGGTYVNMEGPAFSTQAESNFYRSINAAVIGMTNLAEAKLAREAEICYSTVSMVTDFDCWHPEHDHVSVDMVLGHLQANSILGRAIINKITQKHDSLKRNCSCKNALENSIITAPDAISDEVKERLNIIIGKYI